MNINMKKEDRVFIIAEAGVNHNGSLDIALKLCAIAKESGADAVKFQTYKTELIAAQSAKMAAYQQANVSLSKKTQFQMLKELELPFAAFRKIKGHCDKLGLEFLSTPDDFQSLDFLTGIGMNRIKVGSAMIDNMPFLRRVASKRKQVLLSTGLSSLREIKAAYNLLKQNGASSVALLHCTTSYPCQMNEVNLRVIPKLKEIFNTDIGYSDHTQGVEVPVAAVSLGARIIEKHFTLDKRMSGPDHSASLGPSELKSMVLAIRNIEKALGSSIKKPTISELKNISNVRRVIVAAKDINSGERLNEKNIAIKIAEGGISASLWERVIGKKAKRDFMRDEAIKI